jgi:signal transduction histidine kinase
MSTSRSVQRVDVIAVTAAATIVCWRSSFISHPPFFVVFFGIVVPLVGLPAQADRARHAPTAVEREQSRLLRGALLPALAVGTVWLVAWAVHRGTGSSAAARVDVHLQAWFPAAFAVVPIVLFVGILRYRLWDIDVALSKTLLYGAIALAASLLFIAVVALAGRVLGTGLASTAVAVGVVAMAIDPLRAAIRSRANRVVFGQALSPNEALDALADGLERLSPDDEMRELVRVVVEATRASAATLWVRSADGADVPAVTWPPGAQPAPADGAFALVYEDSTLGSLAVAAPGVSLTRADRELIEDVARHGGLLLHNSLLTEQLAQRADELAVRTDELRVSRRHVVAAQDAERRRLERDLHDGAQQNLVACLLTLRVVGDRAARGDLEGAARDLAVAREGIDTTGEELGRLCGGEVPPTLATGGWSAAVENGAEPMRRSGVEVHIDDRRTAPTHDDVETALYFCALEALQNVAKHAHATVAVVTLREEGGEATLTVVDNGVGIAVGAVAGSGLTNLAERVEVLGGTATLSRGAGGGTVVRVVVPVAHAVEVVAT